MDINEIKGDGFNRHPWELSRTKCVMNDINTLIETDNNSKYLNIGAGDLYFDEAWIKNYATKSMVYAVDIGYGQKTPVIWDENKCKLFSNINEVEENDFNYALMMDSLEYIEDDKGFVDALAKKIKPGGKLVFTVPAYRWLYSGYDVNVGNLRRYSIDDLKKKLEGIKDIEIEYSHYFYFSLLLVRIIQKAVGTRFAPHEEVTTGWKHSENSLVTNTVCNILNIDYGVCRFLRKIHFPGLSLLIVCKKK